MQFMNETLDDQNIMIEKLEKRLFLLKNHVCFGKNGWKNIQCSGHGECVQKDQCDCDEEWGGNQCQFRRWIGIEINAKQTGVDGHSAVVYQDKMWIFGGWNGKNRQNEIWFLDFSNSSWNQVISDEPLPAERRGHTSVVYQDSFWVLSGVNNPSSSSPYFEDLWRFDFSELAWNQVFTSLPLEARGFHTSVVYQNSMWVFGGDSGNLRNDLWEFDFVSLGFVSWNESFIAAPPNPREWHSAVVYDDSMWIFGGLGEGSEIMNDVSKLSFLHSQWDINDSPMDRTATYGHSAVVYNDHMWIFGGFSTALENDLWKFNFENSEWTNVSTIATISGRFLHSAVVHQDMMWIFGGRIGAARLKETFSIVLE